ncbi:MAG: 4-alpha-glucanotransferase [Spirochaetota bacterium]
MKMSSEIDGALQALGKKRVLLQIHDPSFPGSPEEDVGRGTPYGRAGFELARFARSLGFTGIQLGPQGQTSRDNPSPYDSTAFSRSFLSISFASLRDDPELGALVDDREVRAALARASRAPSGRTQYQLAFDSQRALAHTAYDRFRTERAAGLIRTDDFVAFTERHRSWLEPDAVFDALSREHGTTDWRQWAGSTANVDRVLYCPPPELAEAAASRLSDLRDRNHDELERYALVQYIAHRQHQRFHAHAGRLGLALYADLQVGLALRDRWRLQPLFLPGYLLGAPPSRTNREGQPWGYPILNPRTYFEETTIGSGTAYLRSRAEKLFTEFDGVRIDHPQGLVCPWLYRTDDDDPFHAVQNGARLFSSPNLSDHPALADYAIARAEQLADEREVARYTDGWVRELDSDQVDRYATLLSVIMDAAQHHDLDLRAIACETLSTQPYPLKRVMEKFGLGRFRVTQKMNVTDPQDVYRTDNAVAADWVMMGNHDTRPIWARVAEWREQDALGDRANYLARRLVPEDHVDAYRRQLRADDGKLVHAYFADALLSNAENVAVFFADLLGSTETYNAPGTVGPENWNLRIPHDYQERYRRDARELRALNIEYACSLALRSPLARAVTSPAPRA